MGCRQGPSSHRFRLMGWLLSPYLLGACFVTWLGTQLSLISFFPLQVSGAVPSVVAWAIASLTVLSWRRCRPSKSATLAARTT